MASRRHSPARVLLTCALALLLLAPALGVVACRPRRSRPFNVVVVLSDALRASNLPFYGYPRKTAPHLAALARESVLFARHFADYPGTPISVSQIMTGRFMAPLLMNPKLVSVPVKALGPDLLVLPRAFRDAGFRTALVSAHPWFEGARLLDAFDEHTLVEPARGEAYAPFEELMRPVTRFLDRTREPFFLYLHSMDTHDPYILHEGYTPYREATAWPPVYNAYDSEILYTDHWVGELLAALRERGLLERTIFVFTSDHGEELGEMGPEFWNRRHGYSLREVQLHVPLLVRLPHGRLGGSVREAPSEHVDLAPTLLRLAVPGASLAGRRVDGRDLSPDLLGADPPGASARGPRPTFSYTWRYWAVHQGDLELQWDQWRDRYSLYRTVTSRFNYPMSVALHDPEIEARLEAELTPVRRRRSREHLRMPALGALPPATLIAFPTTVLGRGSAPLTYDRSLSDDRWLCVPGKRLEAGPRERPGPLALGMPWVPGRYRVRVRLAPDRAELGWKNRFLLRFRSEGGDPVAVDGARADAQGLVDVGVHELGPYLELELSAPRGGVSLLGLALQPVGAARGETPEMDEDLERRLRALGYVE